jgi:O-methyltransferase involved in polyketide biosynthesis
VRGPSYRNIDPNVPSVPRIRDYLALGKDHYAADREAAAGLIRVFPVASMLVRESRRLHAETVRSLLGNGVRQFIELGCGIPSHVSASRIAHSAPSVRTVYVDRDVQAIVHARALLDRGPGEMVLDLDVARELVCADARVRAFLDWTRPVGVLATGLLECLADEAADALIRQLVEDLPDGSMVAVNSVVSTDQATRSRVTALMRAATDCPTWTLRAPETLAPWLAPATATIATVYMSSDCLATAVVDVTSARRRRMALR